MFITPKKRLMSITNALATHKYNAYSTTIDLEKAKVEEDGTILAGSPYPFSQHITFPVKNYILDSSFKDTKLIKLTYNSGATYVNKFYNNFSIVHQNNPLLSVTHKIENNRLVIEVRSLSGTINSYQILILNDLTEPIVLDEVYTRSFKYKLHQSANTTSGYSSINGRHANGTPFSSVILSQTFNSRPAGEYRDLYRNTNTNLTAQNSYLSLVSNISQGQVHKIEIYDFMIYKGSDDYPYYPAVEDFPAGSGEVAQGLMFNDINVKEQQEKGISVITGKLITSGYVLEDRLPYPIDDASKENLKMIRFR